MAAKTKSPSLTTRAARRSLAPGGGGTPSSAPRRTSGSENEPRRRRSTSPSSTSSGVTSIDLVDARGGHGVDLAADLEQERVLHDGGERQPHGERGAGAGRRRDADGAVHALEGVAHGVEPDAAAGDVVGRDARRDAGLEQRRVERRLVDGRGGLGVDAAGGDERAAHAGEVDALAVIGDDDLDGVARLARGQRHRPRARLAERGAHLGRLDAVRDRVA